MRDEHRYLRIFVSERVVLMRAGRSLARRMSTTAVISERRALFDDAASEFERGAATLTSFLRQLGAGPPRLRIGAAGLAERVGRLKPNGRVVTRSPLSDLEELDGLTTLIRAAGAAWGALDAADVAAVETVRGHAGRCAHLGQRLEPLRLDSARAALGAGR